MSDTRRPSGILPITPENYPPVVPDFATEEEARDFWDTHDSAFYWDQFEDVTNNPPAELERGPGADVAAARPLLRRGSTSVVTVHLSSEVVDELKAIAERRAMPYQSLVRKWITERLLQEQEKFSNTQRKAS